MAILKGTDALEWLVNNAPSRLKRDGSQAYQQWMLQHLLTDAPDYRAYEAEPHTQLTEGGILDVQIDPELTNGACGFDGPFSVAVNHRGGDYVAVDTTNRLVCLVMAKSAKLDRPGFGKTDAPNWTDVYVVGRLKEGVRSGEFYGYELFHANGFVAALKGQKAALELRQTAGLRQLFIPAAPQAYPAKDDNGEYDGSAVCTTGVVREIPENGDLNHNGSTKDDVLVEVPLAKLVGRENGDIVCLDGEYFVLHQPSWLREGTVFHAVVCCLEEPCYPVGMARGDLQKYFTRCHHLHAAARVLEYGLLPKSGPRQVDDIPAHHMAT